MTTDERCNTYAEAYAVGLHAELAMETRTDPDVFLEHLKTAFRIGYKVRAREFPCSRRIRKARDGKP